MVRTGWRGRHPSPFPRPEEAAMTDEERRGLEADVHRMAQLDELRADLNIERVSYGGERVSAQVVGMIAGAVAYVGSIEFRRARGG